MTASDVLGKASKYTLKAHTLKGWDGIAVRLSVLWIAGVWIPLPEVEVAV